MQNTLPESLPSLHTTPIHPVIQLQPTGSGIQNTLPESFTFIAFCTHPPTHTATTCGMWHTEPQYRTHCLKAYLHCILLPSIQSYSYNLQGLAYRTHYLNKMTQLSHHHMHAHNPNQICQLHKLSNKTDPTILELLMKTYQMSCLKYIPLNSLQNMQNLKLQPIIIKLYPFKLIQVQTHFHDSLFISFNTKLQTMFLGIMILSSTFGLWLVLLACYDLLACNDSLPVRQLGPMNPGLHTHFPVLSSHIPPL